MRANTQSDLLSSAITIKTAAHTAMRKKPEKSPLRAKFLSVGASGPTPGCCPMGTNPRLQKSSNIKHADMPNNI